MAKRNRQKKRRTIWDWLNDLRGTLRRANDNHLFKHPVDDIARAAAALCDVECKYGELLQRTTRGSELPDLDHVLEHRWCEKAANTLLSLDVPDDPNSRQYALYRLLRIMAGELESPEVA